MKKVTYKDKTAEVLLKTLISKREDLRKFRFGAAGATSKNSKEGRNTRKEIARILTEINMMNKHD
jgi:ribosomal protein L29